MKIFIDLDFQLIFIIFFIIFILLLIFYFVSLSLCLLLFRDKKRKYIQKLLENIVEEYEILSKLVGNYLVEVEVDGII